MSITFEQACRFATATLEPVWPIGTFHVAPWGYEDEGVFLVVVGAREWLEGRDFAYMDTSGLLTLVDKSSGAVRRESAIPLLDQLDHMTPCGERELDLEDTQPA